MRFDSTTQNSIQLLSNALVGEGLTCRVGQPLWTTWATLDWPLEPKTHLSFAVPYESTTFWQAFGPCEMRMFCDPGLYGIAREKWKPTRSS